MTILGRLAFFFVVVPLVELALLIQLGRWVGLWPTVALVFATGFLGAALARAEGMRVLWAFRKDVAAGRMPGRAILDGLAVLVGGVFLLTPGLLTDLAGLFLLFPPTRAFLRRRAERRIRRMVREGTIRVATSGGGFGGGWPPGAGTPGEGGWPGRTGGPGGWDPEGPSEGPPPDAGLDPDREIPR